MHLGNRENREAVIAFVQICIHSLTRSSFVDIPQHETANLKAPFPYSNRDILPLLSECHLENEKHVGIFNSLSTSALLNVN